MWIFPHCAFAQMEEIVREPIQNGFVLRMSLRVQVPADQNSYCFDLVLRLPISGYFASLLFQFNVLSWSKTYISKRAQIVHLGDVHC